MTQVSTEVFTHKLKIKGDETRYITRKFAESMFQQLNDPETKTVTISNPATLTYIQKYKADVELTELKGDEKSFEDILYSHGFQAHQKDYIRTVWEQRKKDNKSTSPQVLQEMIEAYKKNGFL